MNHQSSSTKVDALSLRGKCANFAKTWSTEFGLSEQELVRVGLDTLADQAPKAQLVEELTQAVAREVSKDINAFFDIDRSTPHMMNFNLDGQTYVISVRKFINLLSVESRAELQQ
jgi:hypothetical protein